MRNCVSSRKSLRLRETITVEMHPATGRLSLGFIVDEVSIHVRLRLRRVVSHRETRHRFGNRAMYCAGSNSSSQEMNPTLRKRLLLRADCYVLLSYSMRIPKREKKEQERERGYFNIQAHGICRNSQGLFTQTDVHLTSQLILE